jgi:hypothetical protein
LATLRTRIINLPARIASTDRRQMLHLPNAPALGQQLGISMVDRGQPTASHRDLTHPAGTIHAGACRTAST